MDQDAVKQTEREENDTYFGKQGLKNTQEFDCTAPFDEIKEGMEVITEDNNVFKLTLNSSTGNKVVILPEKCSVTIHYEFNIEGQDEPFDSTFIRGMPEKFKLDSEQLLPGIEITLRTMKIGDTAVIIMDSQYAFGKNGFPPRIPGGTDILAVVKLISFVPEGQGEKLLELDWNTRSNLPLSEIIEAVNSDHQAGNQFVKDEEWQSALNNYNVATKLLHERKYEKTEEMKVIEEKLYLNKAFCYLQLDKPQKVVDQCKLVLDLNKKSVKAYFRMGKAYQDLGMLEQAKEALSSAHELAPADRSVLAELITLDTSLQHRKNEEQTLYRHMFKNVKNVAKKSPDTKFKETEIFKVLEEFKNDEEREELVLPLNLLQESLKTLESCVEHLNLNKRYTSSSIDVNQRVYITKKSK